MFTRLLLALANRLPQSRNGFRLRRQVLLLAGMRLARNVVVLAPVHIDGKGPLERLSIARNSFLNHGTRFHGAGKVTIGSFVQIGTNVSFQTSNHPVDFVPGKARPTITRPILVEDHVWIGAGAMILPGVTIGRGSVVAAGAIVHRDVPPLTLVGGVPARVIKQVSELPADGS